MTKTELDFFKIFIYLAVPGLSCGTRDVQFSLQHVGSLVATGCSIFIAARGFFSCGLWDLIP